MVDTTKKVEEAVAGTTLDILLVGIEMTIGVKIEETVTEEIEVAEMRGVVVGTIVIINLTILISRGIKALQMTLRMMKVIAGMASNGCKSPAILLIRWLIMSIVKWKK